MHKPQTFRVVSHCKCIQEKRTLDCDVARFSIQEHSLCKKLTFECQCIKLESIDFLKEDEDFGSDVMEQEDQLGVTALVVKSNSANDAIINLFILQHINQEINDVEVIMLGVSVVDKVQIHFQKKNCFQ